MVGRYEWESAGADAPAPLCSLHGFAVQADIQPAHLRFLVDTQADQHFDDEEDDERHKSAPDDGRQNALDLRPYLSRIAVEEAGDRHAGRVVSGDPRIGENAGENRADDAAYAMDTEHVQRIVVA